MDDVLDDGPNDDKAWVSHLAPHPTKGWSKLCNMSEPALQFPGGPMGSVGSASEHFWAANGATRSHLNLMQSVEFGNAMSPHHMEETPVVRCKSCSSVGGRWT